MFVSISRRQNIWDFGRFNIREIIIDSSLSIDYEESVVYSRYFLTHAEYNKIGGKMMPYY
jgi:mRNA-degrading endonuclease HigB of HigAB toxin-antitoxin module